MRLWWAAGMSDCNEGIKTSPTWTILQANRHWVQMITEQGHGWKSWKAVCLFVRKWNISVNEIYVYNTNLTIPCAVQLYKYCCQSMLHFNSSNTNIVCMGYEPVLMVLSHQQVQWWLQRYTCFLFQNYFICLNRWCHLTHCSLVMPYGIIELGQR